MAWILQIMTINIDHFNVIDQGVSQVAHEVKETIHMQKLDPELNKNVGKMVIPHVFDAPLGAKPPNPCVSSFLSKFRHSSHSISFFH